MEQNNDKWTEIEHLPEWDEEFYDVYTARKFGKWVMFKTLKENFRNDPRMQSMMEKEFEVRYNLSHPNIIMINDYEEVPTVGKAIITDDVYGTSLKKLIEQGKVTQHHINQILERLTDAIDYIQRNHIVHAPITSENVIFTEKIENLKLINVGFDQHSHLTPAETSEDISNFGKVLEAALDAEGGSHPNLRRIVARTKKKQHAGGYNSIHSLRLDIEHRTDRVLYLTIIILVVAMITLLAWLVSGHGPIPATT